MNIGYIGNFKPAHSTETHISATLTDMGHDVLEFQEDEIGADPITESIRRATPDILLWTRTWGIKPTSKSRPSDEAGHAVLAAARELGIPTASWHLDLYAGLKRGAGLSTDPFWCTDYVFTPDGGSDELWAKHGINHHYLRPAVFKYDCYLAEPDPSLAADVVFVGSGNPKGGNYHPEWPYRKELLRWLQRTYGSRFVKHGNPPLNGGEGTIRGHRLNRLYASAKVVVGDTLCLGPGEAKKPLFQHEGYWSDRLYETLGRGGVLVHPWIKGITDEFGEHAHAPPFFYEYGDFNELGATIDWVLQCSADQRDEWRRAAIRHVRDNCSYHERAAEVLRVVGVTSPEPQSTELP